MNTVPLNNIQLCMNFYVILSSSQYHIIREKSVNKIKSDLKKNVSVSFKWYPDDLDPHTPFHSDDHYQ